MIDEGNNIKEFMKKYGVEGFLEIYFTKFLFHALKFQMKSTLEGCNELDEDSGIAFYLKDKKIGNAEDVEKFEKELEEICNQVSKKMIQELKNEKDFQELFEGKLDKLKDEVLEKKFTKKLHQIIKELKYKNE
jgi:hypothetical protein